MRVNDMARIQNFDVGKFLGGKSKADVDIVAQADKYVTANTPFSPPNWNHMATKTEPSMSDDEFENAIREMARQDAANGVIQGENPEKAKLRNAYVSVVSPDRKAAYNQTMAKTGGKIPINQSIYGNDGGRLMHYNPSGFWLPSSTKGELSRMADFNRIYNEAYSAYEAEHGKVQSSQSSGTSQVMKHTKPY